MAFLKELIVNGDSKFNGINFFNEDIIFEKKSSSIRNTTNSGCLSITGGKESSNASKSGASLFLFGSEWNENWASPSSFTIYCVPKEGEMKILTGNSSGNLTWNGNDISGNVRQISFTVNSSNVSTTLGSHQVCYQVGHICCLNININLLNNTTGSGEVLISGLPIPYGGTTPAGCMVSASVVSRLCVNQNGQLVTDGAITGSGWYNGELSYVTV